MDISVAVIAVKAVVYFSVLAASGGALFVVLFQAHLTEAERDSIYRFTRAMAVFGLFATFARVLSLSAMLGDNVASAWDASLIGLVLDGSEGRSALLRSVGLVVLALSLFASSRLQMVGLAGALASVTSFGVTGHAGASGLLAIGIVTVHLLAVSYWIGALIPLFRLTRETPSSRLSTVLTRFGELAVGVVGLLAIAGLALLWLFLGSPLAVLDSDYGRLVLLKLATVGALLLLAGANKFWLTPSIAMDRPGARAQLRWSIAAEITLVVAILIVTATFTTITGPPEPR